ncbi:MAG: YceI family protein [Polyangiaceae bacterium]
MTTSNWNLDTTHSSIGFTVRHMVFAKVRGRFASWQGKVELDPDDLTRARVDVEIDATSIDTGVADRDNHLRSGDFLDTEQYPKLRFVSSKVEKVEGDRYRIHGALTIRDVTRDVVLDAEYGGLAIDPWGNRRVAFTATASLDRREFGLTWNQVLEAGGVLVGERIDVEIDVQAVKSSAALAS